MRTIVTPDCEQVVATATNQTLRGQGADPLSWVGTFHFRRDDSSAGALGGGQLRVGRGSGCSGAAASALPPMTGRLAIVARGSAYEEESCDIQPLSGKQHCVCRDLYNYHAF